MLLKGKHIFIIEDNAQNRVTFKMILLMQGAHVTFERWGQDALHVLKQEQKVDLIILDLNLYNGLSGYAIFDQIRGSHEFDAIPIIAVSATDPSTAIPEVQKKGFAGFIAKPISDTTFPAQIAKILAGEKVWDVGRF